MTVTFTLFQNCEIFGECKIFRTTLAGLSVSDMKADSIYILYLTLGLSCQSLTTESDQPGPWSEDGLGALSVGHAIPPEILDVDV